MALEVESLDIREWIETIRVMLGYDWSKDTFDKCELDMLRAIKTL